MSSPPPHEFCLTQGLSPSELISLISMVNPNDRLVYVPGGGGGSTHLRLSNWVGGWPLTLSQTARRTNNTPCHNIPYILKTFIWPYPVAILHTSDRPCPYCCFTVKKKKKKMKKMKNSKSVASRRASRTQRAAGAEIAAAGLS